MRACSIIIKWYQQEHTGENKVSKIWKNVNWFADWPQFPKSEPEEDECEECEPAVKPCDRAIEQCNRAVEQYDPKIGTLIDSDNYDL